MYGHHSRFCLRQFMLFSVIIIHVVCCLPFCPAEVGRITVTAMQT